MHMLGKYGEGGPGPLLRTRLLALRFAFFICIKKGVGPFGKGPQPCPSPILSSLHAVQLGPALTSPLAGSEQVFTILSVCFFYKILLD